MTHEHPDDAVLLALPHDVAAIIRETEDRCAQVWADHGREQRAEGRDQAIRECIAAVEDIPHVETTAYAGRYLPQRTVVLALRGLLDTP